MIITQGIRCSGYLQPSTCGARGDNFEVIRHARKHGRAHPTAPGALHDREGEGVTPLPWRGRKFFAGLFLCRLAGKIGRAVEIRYRAKTKIRRHRARSARQR
jgi:hypothetical protein